MGLEELKRAQWGQVNWRNEIAELIYTPKAKNSEISAIESLNSFWREKIYSKQKG